MENSIQLAGIIAYVEQNLSSFTKEEWNSKPNPAKWSKKEIIGHLIDSEYNNHARIIKVLISDEPIVMENYIQDEWVKLNRYQSWDLSDVFTAWKLHQQSMIKLIADISEGELNKIIIVGGEPRNLDFLITDYVRHQMHHLKQVFGVEITV